MSWAWQPEAPPRSGMCSGLYWVPREGRQAVWVGGEGKGEKAGVGSGFLRMEYGWGVGGGDPHKGW